MSGSQVETDKPVAGDDADTVAAARRMGWKPREEFTDKPEKWVDADAFLKRGFETPAILMDRYKQLDERSVRMEQELNGTRGELREAVSTIQTMTGMMRTSEQRAYDRARKELLAEREKAVETGDTATFKRLDGELEELHKTAPAAATVTKPAGTVETPAGPVTPAGQGQAFPPEVTAFYARSPWYNFQGNSSGQADLEMSRWADAIHMGLLTTRKDLTLSQNLAEVEREVRQRFPQKFGGTATAKPNGAAQTNGNGAGAGDDDDDGGAPAVSPSGGTGSRRQAQRFTFDAMPRDSKQAYERYSKQLAGKGDPLTKEEWARDYWSQFQDDGA